jgi:GNAT superfamily N-acetyltransferase
MDGNAETWIRSPDHAGRSGSTARQSSGLPAGHRSGGAPDTGPAGAGDEAAIPPLCGDADLHGSEATHGATIADRRDPAPASFEISYDAEAVQVPQLLELFASTWWAAGRTEAEARAIVAGSDVVVTVRERRSARLAGFARVLTDRTYLALVLDVIVAPGVRGAGVGAMVMDAVLAHPWVADAGSCELVCRPDLIGFYRRWGFTDRVGQSRLMRRTADPALGG